MTTDHNQAHILIVDDDERIRNLLQKFLLRNDFFVSIARDAAHAGGHSVMDDDTTTPQVPLPRMSEWQEWGPNDKDIHT